MPKSDAVRLRHMLDAAREARGFVQDRTRTDLDRDRLLNLALVRLLEIIGEAARQVSPETRERHSEVRWLDIADMRNRLAHGYADINLDIVWDVLSQEVPPLISQLERILAGGKRD